MPNNFMVCFEMWSSNLWVFIEFRTHRELISQLTYNVLPGHNLAAKYFLLVKAARCKGNALYILRQCKNKLSFLISMGVWTKVHSPLYDVVCHGLSCECMDCEYLKVPLYKIVYFRPAKRFFASFFVLLWTITKIDKSDNESMHYSYCWFSPIFSNLHTHVNCHTVKQWLC